MQRVYKRGRVWWGWVYVGGKRECRSTKCRDKRAAEAVIAGWERAEADPNYRAANETSLASALERLLTDREERGRAAGTVAMYESKALHIIRILGRDTPLARLTATAVDRFVSTRLEEGAARTTIGKELTTLRSALKIAKRRGEFTADVAAVMPIQWATEYRPRTRFLTAPEVQALLRELLPDRGAHVAYILATAASWGESTRARRSDIDLTRGQVLVRGSKNKYRRDRPVPIVAFAWPLLQHALQIRGDVTGPIFRPWTNVRHDLATACRRAGIAACTPNDLRRTAATWLRQLGVEPSLIGAMLGHSDSRMVERVYGRMPVESLGAAVRARVGDCSAFVADTAGRAGESGPSAEVDRLGLPRNVVPRDGIEPPTRGFSIPSSRRTSRGERPKLRRAM
jgi:integrase